MSKIDYERAKNLSDFWVQMDAVKALSPQWTDEQDGMVNLARAYLNSRAENDYLNEDIKYLHKFVGDVAHWRDECAKADLEFDLVPRQFRDTEEWSLLERTAQATLTESLATIEEKEER